MPAFAYQAKDMGGEFYAGVLEAEDARAVARELKKQGLFITTLTPVSAEDAPVGARATLRLFPAGWGRTSSHELALLARQLGVMLAAGLPILQALQVTSEQAGRLELRRSLERVRRRVEEGESLADALREQPRVFPPLFVHMVEAGEAGGILDEVMQRLASHYESEHELNQKLRSAITYPVVVSGLAVVVLFVLVSFVLPQFARTFATLETPLPWPTRVIMGVSGFLGRFWWLVALILLVASGGLWWFFRTPQGQRDKDTLLLHLPLLGRVLRWHLAARFSRNLATLVRGGIPILRALEIVEKLLGNTVITSAVERARTRIGEGQGIASPLEATGALPRMVTQMVEVGEETGNVDTMLDRVASFYETEVEYTTKNLVSLIEPLVIVFLGLMVGILVAGTVLPMFTLLDAID